MHKELWGIDKERFVLLLRLFQHYDASGNAHTEKQVLRQLNHGVNIIVVDKIFADFLLCATAIKHAGKLHDSRGSLGGEPRKHVHGESQVALAFRCQHAGRGKARVVDERGIVGANPWFWIGWVGNYGIERLIAPVVRLKQRVAIADVEVGIVDVVQKHIDTAQVVGGDVEFLSEKSLFHIVLAQNFSKFQQ